MQTLSLRVDENPYSAQQQVIDHEAVELVSVNGEVALSAVVPGVLLIDLDPDEVGHDVGQSLIVIAFHPYHLNIALGIGKLADVRKQVPMLFLQTAEVQVVEDVAQQHQPVKSNALQHGLHIAGAAGFRAEVNIGEDDRIETRFPHSFLPIADVLWEYEIPRKKFGCVPFALRSSSRLQRAYSLPGNFRYNSTFHSPSPMSNHEYELVVIGSGPAGQKAAICAAKFRKKVAIIDRKKMLGGVCVNTGTIP